MPVPRMKGRKLLSTYEREKLPENTKGYIFNGEARQWWLHPGQGMTYDFSEACGTYSFSWIKNYLRDDKDMYFLPKR